MATGAGVRPCTRGAPPQPPPSERRPGCRIASIPRRYLRVSRTSSMSGSDILSSSGRCMAVASRSATRLAPSRSPPLKVTDRSSRLEMTSRPGAPLPSALNRNRTDLDERATATGAAPAPRPQSSSGPGGDDRRMRRYGDSETERCHQVDEMLVDPLPPTIKPVGTGSREKTREAASSSRQGLPPMPAHLILLRCGDLNDWRRTAKVP